MITGKSTRSSEKKMSGENLGVPLLSDFPLGQRLKHDGLTDRLETKTVLKSGLKDDEDDRDVSQRFCP